MKKSLMLLAAALLAGCTSSNAIRTSQDTAIIQTQAAPACGGAGAARVAERQAAIETLRAGYDRYVIYDAASQNSVRAMQMPGSYQTTGMASGGMFSATTVYQPGPVVFAGNHEQSFAIKMFNDADPNSSRAISARDVLGPEWEKALEKGALGTCF